MYINSNYIKQEVQIALESLDEGDTTHATATLTRLLGDLKDQEPKPMIVLTDEALDACYQTDIDTTLYDEALIINQQE